MKDFRQVRVVVGGASGFGRDVVRGVVDYTRVNNPGWRIHVELHVGGPHGPDWQKDEGTIFALADQALFDEIHARGLPLVNCLAHFEDTGVATVRTDDLAIGEMAAEYLLGRGFEDFAFFSAGDVRLAATLRFEGFRRRIEQAGFQARWVFRGGGDPPRRRLDSWERLARWLSHQSRPLALMCSHDTLARVVSAYLTGAGVAVPERVALIGVDNDTLQCELAVPALTSVEVPSRHLGFEAARQLDRIFQTGQPEASPILVRPLGVVERQSTDTLAAVDDQLAQAVRYIRLHACDPCTVDDVASHVATSRRYLEVLFKRHLHQTPHEAIMRVRMTNACLLLRDSRIPIQTVARRSGYELIQNFGRAFAQHMGQTPAVYRRQHAMLAD